MFRSVGQVPPIFRRDRLNDVILLELPVISCKKTDKAGEGFVGRILKWLIYLAIIGAVALVAYAYVGPFFGADFSPPQTEIRQPVTLDAD
ncbi:hypothetical protein [Marivita sp. GX14005]|uniref:hypothetical protein n=1 Tax=Marivita sp. GX14005 TaxID=2942276 RepID=UPI00201894E2|nr:hypothetical protein [Marivita sp. GX14005]MCL3882602.1 hypothetical protein [Marivita sp. GX14005]